ncbi:hypothetical protein BaRGS_00035043, partial [Batillaria attramentaria]
MSENHQRARTSRLGTSSASSVRSSLTSRNGHKSAPSTNTDNTSLRQDREDERRRSTGSSGKTKQAQEPRSHTRQNERRREKEGNFVVSKDQQEKRNMYGVLDKRGKEPDKDENVHGNMRKTTRDKDSRVSRGGSNDGQEQKRNARTQNRSSKDTDGDLEKTTREKECQVLRSENTRGQEQRGSARTHSRGSSNHESAHRKNPGEDGREQAYKGSDDAVNCKEDEDKNRNDACKETPSDQDDTQTNRRNTEQDEFLEMFLSTEDMDSEEEYPEGRGRGSRGGRRLAWQCTEEARKKHEELLRKILEEFDLERTKEKYRNAYVIERQRNGKSVADYQFRAELERMMGSEVIRINDKTWSKRFTEKLLEDYYEQQPYERRLTITRMQEKWKRMSCKPPHELDEAVRRKLRRDDELNHRRMTLNTRRQTNIYTGPSLTIEENVGKLNLKDSDVDGVAESKPRVGLTAEDRRQRAAELMRQKRFSKVLPDDVQKIYYEE